MWLLPILVLSLVFWATSIFGQTVTYDMGGSVKARIEQMQGRDGVVIDGKCFSACTMYLDLPNTCVTKKARLGFHSPSTKSGIMLTRENWEAETKLMASHYPKQISEWYMAEARYKAEIVILTGKQAIAMGAKACKI